LTCRHFRCSSGRTQCAILPATTQAAGKRFARRANFDCGRASLRAQHDVEPTDDQGEIAQLARESCREHLRARRDFAMHRLLEKLDPPTVTEGHALVLVE